MSSCVYVIQADNEEIKVGLSGTPFARLSKVKAEYGDRRRFTSAYLVGYAVTKFGLAVESHVHRELEQYAVGGEWYRINSLYALGVVTQVARSFDAASVTYAIGPEEHKVPVRIVRSVLGLCRRGSRIHPTYQQAALRL